MPRERKPSDKVDGWVLHRLLGEGGNGEVWIAERGGTTAALKFLKSKFLEATNKRFIRFRDEALTHSRLAPDHPGLLPLLAHSIPSDPGPNAPAWLATSIATTAKKALEGKPLVDAVGAILMVAETLAALHAQHVSHRDIKPDNLFQLDNRWLVGDLGLVDFPEKDAITESGERLGPWSYLAPEMLDEAKRADGTKVDVYSLAKTLWVLATEQNIPPSGEIRTDIQQFGIGVYRAHPRAHQLNALIERSTRHDPALRPTMADFAVDLRSWLSTPAIAPQPDLTEILARIHAQSAPILRAQDERRDREAQAQALVLRLRELMQPIGEAFAATNLSSGEIAVDTSARGRVLGPPLAEPVQTTWESGLVIKASIPTAPTSTGPFGMKWVHLTCEVSVELRSDLTMRLAGGFLIQTMFGVDYHAISHFTAPPASATLEHSIAALITHLRQELSPALAEFLGWVERGGEPPHRLS